jgi:hypothetical protein
MVGEHGFVLIADLGGNHFGSLADKDVIHFEGSLTATFPEVKRGARAGFGVEGLEGVDQRMFPCLLATGECHAFSC